MTKLAVVEVLGKLLKRYFMSYSDMGRDCRLLVPGLTTKIALQLHETLMHKGINSYLVISDGETPSENRNLIRAVGLTSKRINSFVAITSPGQLVHIQDSVRGTGGAIRSLAFSEEWPWIDNGSEPFRFDGPVLDELVRKWSDDQNKQVWMRKFVLDGLVKHTRTSPRRVWLLLECILGSFDPFDYREIDDVREQLLFHSGVPRATDKIENVIELLRSSVRLNQKVIERCQKEEDIRDQARDMVREVVIPEGEQTKVRTAVDNLLDGIGKSTKTGSGLLAFHSCWDSSTSGTTYWSCLTAKRLAEIFNVKEHEKADINITIHCDRAIFEEDKRNCKLATFVGEEIRLDISYKIPPNQFSGHSWMAKVLNRQKVIVEKRIIDTGGKLTLTFNTADSTTRYSKKIPVKIALFKDDVLDTAARLDLHLCCEDRPAFTVIKPGFHVADAFLTDSLTDSEEVPDQKLEVDEPVHLYIFSHNIHDVDLCDENDESLDLLEEMSGIWKSGQPVDVDAGSDGQLVRFCKFKDRRSVIYFEAKDRDKGEFTVEDELRVMLSQSKGNQVKKLVELFAGKNPKPYLALGQLDHTARKRIAMANAMTCPTGWRPLLVNLLEPGRLELSSLDFINLLGDDLDEKQFCALELPEDALPLVKGYSEAREAVRHEVGRSVDNNEVTVEHPVYASHPIFSQKHATHMEQVLVGYLEAYHGILDYLDRKHNLIEWRQLFVLNHLDCAVHWDKSQLSNSVILIGPWHPLVLAKRFMVQSTLFSRADLMLRNQDQKSFRHLATLLDRVQGFRWGIGVSADYGELEPMYVSVTSDPGWHLAFKRNCDDLAMREDLGGLTGIFSKIRSNFGLETEVLNSSNDNLAVTSLSSYLRAFPSRRSVGMRIFSGYLGSRIVAAVDSYLHDDEGPTEQGLQLPGGVRLYFKDELSETGDARWSDPPFYIYRYRDDTECIQNEYPDINLLSPRDDMSFKDTDKSYDLPRGTGLETVFSQPLKFLTEGQSPIPKSITYECSTKQEQSEGIGCAFEQATIKTRQVLGSALATVHSASLPENLNAPWVVIPGKGIDPAILVKYVRDRADREIRKLALWDYKLDIGKKDTSFYILSTIPKGFQVAVNGFFGGKDIANEFVVELGRIGISIGGEALKSGRHALGVVGLVGAVRLFQGSGVGTPYPFTVDSEAVGFLIPVDPFASFFGKVGSGQSGLDGKRSDLLAVQVSLSQEASRNMKISCSGIESKFTSGAFDLQRAHDALKQASATGSEFRMLVETSLCSGSMPERLAFLELMKFGLRISSPSSPSEIDNWVRTEAKIYRAILTGNYEYCEPKYKAVLVSTEEQLPGVAEYTTLQEGIWVRLTKGHWPGVTETQQLQLIREELSTQFSTCVEQVRENYESTLGGQRGEKVIFESKQLDKELQKQEKPEPDTGVQEKTRTAPEVKEEGTPEGKVLDQIFLGVDDRRRSVYFNPQSPVDPLDNLNFMITGSSGTGKTQLLKYLICKLREQNKSVLILDFKNDFASDKAFAERSSLDRVFVPFDGLPYNPLIPYPVKHPGTGELFAQCDQHLAGVASVLKRTYGLGAQQQAAVKNAMITAFSSKGIQTSGLIRYSEGMSFPDFSHVGDTLKHDNPSAYNRLDPLFTLGLFKNEFKGASFEPLIERSAILDLSQIPSDEIKNTLAQLVVLSAHAYYNSQPHQGSMRQVLVFDEAHRVLSSGYMPRLVRECRAYGVATFLSSQYPSDFPSEISASMATKVIHGNGRDSDKVKEIIQILGFKGKDRESDVADLERFQAFVDNRHHPHTIMRTMNYPLYLVWRKLKESRIATLEELSQADGIDPSKLPIVNFVTQLERLGLAEESEGQVSMLSNE